MADRPAATDGLFDTSPRAMAARYGELALARMRAGRDPREAARLAASFAIKALEEDAATVLPFRGDRRGGKRDDAWTNN